MGVEIIQLKNHKIGDQHLVNFTQRKEETMSIGHIMIGKGPEKVFLLHDWLGDHFNYEPMFPYLDESAFSYALIDLRGYGK